MVLVGPNASGKSSILRAVTLCLGNGTELGSIAVRDFTDPSQPLTLEVVLDGLDNDDRAAFPDEVDVSTVVTLSLRVMATVDASDPDSTLVVERRFPSAGHTRRPSSAQLERFGYAFVPAARSLGRELAGAQGVARRLLTGLDMTADGPALATAQNAIRDALAASATIGGFRTQLASRLTEALPREVTPDEVQLIMATDLLDSPLAGTTLTLLDAGTAAPLQEQSDGIQALAVLALTGMQTAHSLIVAIDEPETYLHPTAQRTLVRAMVGGAAQRLIATHSSSVASAVEPHHIVSLTAAGEARQLPAGSSIGEPLRLLRDWRNALIEPLTARLVVLVEGSSDRILVEGVANLLGHRLDTWDVAVFQLDGSGAFRDAWDVFGSPGLDIPTRGICDADAQQRWAATIDIPPGDLAGRGFLVLDPDLEAYYVGALGKSRVLELIDAAGLLNDIQLLAGSGKPDVSLLTDEEVAAACRRHKVAVAASLAIWMSAADASTLLDLQSFIQALAP
jgi:putative ATP-dependent endonuclease of OLD family